MTRCLILSDKPNFINCLPFYFPLQSLRKMGRTQQSQRNTHTISTTNNQTNTLNQQANAQLTQKSANRAQPQKIKVQFKYTFQEYLKLALAKVIPQAGVIIDPEQGFIFGTKQECSRLKKRVERELSARHYKKVELKREHDLDQVEYQLDSVFEARIYRPNYIERALDTLGLYSYFQTFCNKFREILQKKRIVILKIKAQFSEKCMERLQDILRNNVSVQKQRQKPLKISYKSPAFKHEQEEDYEEVIQEEVNYYQLREQAKKKQIVECLNTSSNDESSSFSLTKTESSQFIDEQQSELNTSCIIEEGSKSFA